MPAGAIGLRVEGLGFRSGFRLCARDLLVHAHKVISNGIAGTNRPLAQSLNANLNPKPKP